jgi:hypothetical protein
MSSKREIETRVIKASYILQAKVGAGPLDERRVQDSQRVIDTNTVDFVPMGLEFLDELERLLKDARSRADINPAELRESLTQPIMQLKGNAAMFKYDMVGALANIMLTFLESLHQVDGDAFEIVEAHHKTLKAIIMKRMQGDGGANGLAFQNELKDACRRYFTKRNIPVSGLFTVSTS